MQVPAPARVGAAAARPPPPPRPPALPTALTLSCFNLPRLAPPLLCRYLYPHLTGESPQPTSGMSALKKEIEAAHK